MTFRWSGNDAFLCPGTLGIFPLHLCTQRPGYPWVNSFMQSLLQKMLFYLCLHPINNEDKMIPSVAVTA